MKTTEVRINMDPADHRTAKIIAVTRGITLRGLLAELIRREAAAEAAKPKEAPR